MTRRRAVVIASAAVAAAALSLGGASLAMASTAEPSPSATSDAGTGSGSADVAAGDLDRPASPDTPVTGDEADKVIAAVQAQDADATITEVRKDPDGSYDALGTSGGERVFYEVSADLATVTVAAPPGDGRGPGGPGGPSADTAVTGDEADQVIAAVQAQDADATITEVRKDPDGSYDALGSSGGERVFYEVSADLATVTAGGGPGAGHGPGPGAPGGATSDGASGGASGVSPVASVATTDA